MQFIGIRILLNRLKVIPFFLKDKTVPLYKKLMVILCAVYILAPIDFVPVFPLDDLVLFIFVIWHLKDDLDTYWKGDKDADLSKKFRDKDMVDGVEFTVVDEDAPKGDPEPENQ